MIQSHKDNFESYILYINNDTRTGIHWGVWSLFIISLAWVQLLDVLLRAPAMPTLFSSKYVCPSFLSIAVTDAMTKGSVGRTQLTSIYTFQPITNGSRGRN